MSRVRPGTRHYTVVCSSCGTRYADDGLLLDCARGHEPAFLRTEYHGTGTRPAESRGLFRHAPLLPVARTFPEVTIVLNHIGGPLGIGPDAGKREQVVSGLEHRYLCASDLSKCRREVRRAWLRALWIRPAESYRTAYVD